MLIGPPRPHCSPAAFTCCTRVTATPLYSRRWTAPRRAVGAFRHAGLAGPCTGPWRWSAARCSPGPRRRRDIWPRRRAADRGTAARAAGPSPRRAGAGSAFTGVGDFYQGTLARSIAAASVAAGGPLTLADLRDALPRLATPIELGFHNDKLSFLPPPADGGLAAAAAFQTLEHDPPDPGRRRPAGAGRRRGRALA